VSVLISDLHKQLANLSVISEVATAFIRSVVFVVSAVSVSDPTRNPNRHIQIVADHKLLGLESDRVFWPFRADRCRSDVLHSISTLVRNRVRHIEVECCSFGLGLGVNLLDKLGQLLQRCIQPTIKQATFY